MPLAVGGRKRGGVPSARLLVRLAALEGNRSGEVVGVPPVMLPPTQPELHIACSSQKTLNLLRGVACQVRRSEALRQNWSLMTCWLKSGS